jgi:hypothetical protein
MRAVQKLVRNGNSTQVTILREMLIHLGWLPGEVVVVELQANHTLKIYKPRLEEQAVKQMRPSIIRDRLEFDR